MATQKTSLLARLLLPPLPLKPKPAKRRQIVENRRIRVDRPPVPLIARPPPLKRLRPTPPLRRQIPPLTPPRVSVLERRVKRLPFCRNRQNKPNVRHLTLTRRNPPLLDQTTLHGTLQQKTRPPEKVRTVVVTQKIKRTLTYPLITPLRQPAVVKTVGKTP